MPCYPAFALLLGSAMATGSDWVRRGTQALSVIAGCAAVAALAILFLVRGVPTPGDISTALTSHPSAYTLSLGHMEDLTLASFAYLRLPLVVAALAFSIGALGTLRANAQRAFPAAALMMILFFQAARIALLVFDADLSSRPLAEALLRSPEGKLIVDKHYYPFSSVFFYTNRTALLLNGRAQNLVYGSYAPGAPNVFLDDAGFKNLWLTPGRCYLVASRSQLPRLESLVGLARLSIIAESGGKFLVTNQPLPPIAVRINSGTSFVIVSTHCSQSVLIRKSSGPNTRRARSAERGSNFKLDEDPGCGPEDTSGLPSQGLAALANVSGHELSEARTDRRNGGWYDGAGAENGDK